MLRNVSSGDIVYTDPVSSVTSRPGCIVASPSYANDGKTLTTQDYVKNWTRDSAIAAAEIALSGSIAGDQSASERLADYVKFASLCQSKSQPPNSVGQATYTLDGKPWTSRPDPQNDGPALRAIVLLRSFNTIPVDSQPIAKQVIKTDIDYLLNNDNYKNSSMNLWEEVVGQSFFTRSVLLKCFRQFKSNSIGIVTPSKIDKAIAWLETALDSHWSDADGYYISIEGKPKAGYDPNIDIVMASIYGAVACADPKVLATASKLRYQWTTDPTLAYPINKIDQQREDIGPLMGRYPQDTYDGDYSDPKAPPGHPWSLCSANLAELYYCLAYRLSGDKSLKIDQLARNFYDQVDIHDDTSVADAVGKLRSAGDKVLAAIARHSDHLALSEQFDRENGFEKSVHDLTWSYAAFSSAVRARARINS
jgi:glucoamylase